MPYVACLAHGAGANALVFNYRGVGASAGTARTEQDLILDGSASLTWLFKHGVAPSRVWLHGRGLGAAVAMKVALRVDGRGHQICGVGASHGFRSLGHQAAAYLEVEAATDPVTGEVQPNCASQAVAWLAPAVRVGLRLLGWELDTAGPTMAWHARGGSVLLVYHPKDGVVCARRLYGRATPAGGAQLREAFGGYDRRGGRWKVIRVTANWAGKQAHQYPNVGTNDFHAVTKRIKLWLGDPPGSGGYASSHSTANE